MRDNKGCPALHFLETTENKKKVVPYQNLVMDDKSAQTLKDKIVAVLPTHPCEHPRCGSG